MLRRRTHRRVDLARPARRGAAPLEFVLSLPFLLLVMAMVPALAYSLMAKSQMAIEIRHDVWQQRLVYGDEPRRYGGDNGKILQLAQATGGPSTVIIDETKSRTVDLLPLLRGPFRAVSGNAVLAGTWDWRQVPAFREDWPHVTLMGQLLDPSQVADLSNFSNLLNFTTGPIQGLLSSIAQQVADALADASDAIQSVKKALKALHDAEDFLEDLQDAAGPAGDVFDAPLKEVRDKIKQLEDLLNQITTIHDGAAA